MSQNKDIRITGTDACQKYKLKSTDLNRCDCIIKRNPYYRSKIMRLFLEEDIKELAQIIRTEKEESKIQKQNDKIKIKNDAITMFEELKTTGKHPQQSISENGSNNKLPIDIWENIINCTISEYNPYKLNGVYIIVKRLLIISQICKEAYFAVKTQIKNLDTKLGDNPNSILENTLIHFPTKLTIPELKQIAHLYNVPKSGTKAELINRLYNYLEIIKPLPVYININLYTLFYEECNEHIDNIGLEFNIRMALNIFLKYKKFQEYKTFSEFQDVCSKEFNNSSDNLIKASELLQKQEEDKEALIEKNGIKLIENCITELGVVNSNLIYLFSKSDHIKYGTPSPLDFKDEIINRINNFLNKIQNQCIVCSLQFYARDCINKCCGTCCKDQKCTRHRHK